jgi:hypothetical protein
MGCLVIKFTPDDRFSYCNRAIGRLSSSYGDNQDLLKGGKVKG